MTRTIVAILALSPALLHAQAKSLAQPGSTPVLHSSVVQPAVSPAKDEGAASAVPSLRVTTGVAGPKLIHSEALVSRERLYTLGNSRERTAVVSMTVDRTGKPVDLKIVKSAGPLTDRDVLTAVRRYRYEPATLNGEPVAVENTLSLIIDRN